MTIPSMHTRIEEALVIANNPMVKAEGRINALKDVVDYQALIIEELIKHVAPGKMRWTPAVRVMEPKVRAEQILTTGEERVQA